MKAQRRRETAPELRLRREVWRRGLRYRVDAALPLTKLRRRADLLFTRAQVAVFVDGCFWHSCPIHATSPKSNSAWWAEKLATNVRRDHDTDQRLRDAGWHPLRVWEHENTRSAADRVEALVRGLLPRPRAQEPDR